MHIFVFGRIDSCGVRLVDIGHGHNREMLLWIDMCCVVFWCPWKLGLAGRFARAVDVVAGAC